MNHVFGGQLTADQLAHQQWQGRRHLRLAISEGFTNKAGEQVETTCFADIVVWDRTAEACQKYLGKGSPVLVEGRLETNEWESPQGEKRSKLRVRADRVQFLGQPRQGQQQAQNGDNRKPVRRPAPAAPAEEEAVSF
jgi:single-strand DNA-binding protein